MPVCWENDSTFGPVMSCSVGYSMSLISKSPAHDLNYLEGLMEANKWQFSLDPSDYSQPVVAYVSSAM